MIDDFDSEFCHPAQTNQEQKRQSHNEENDGVTRIFNEILNKPTEYWLLKPTTKV